MNGRLLVASIAAVAVVLAFGQLAAAYKNEKIVQEIQIGLKNYLKSFQDFQKEVRAAAASGSGDALSNQIATELILAYDVPLDKVIKSIEKELSKIRYEDPFMKTFYESIEEVVRNDVSSAYNENAKHLVTMKQLAGVEWASLEKAYKLQQFSDFYLQTLITFRK